MHTSSSSADPCEPLRGIAWRRLRVRLRNVRNAFAKEPPLFIFKGVLKSACSSVEGLKCDYFYHPAGPPWGARIAKDHAYDLDIVFPAATGSEVGAFRDGLARQVEKTPRNFAIESLGPVEQRDLAALESEWRHDPRDTDEVCLDFITPLDFTPPDPARPWMLPAAHLLRLCTVHLVRLFPALPWPMEIPSAGLETLPWFWETAETLWHRSKSQPGTRQPFGGMTGPLFLRGDRVSVLPVLLACSELHTGYGNGDEHGLLAQRHAHHPIASAAGHFILRTGRDHSDFKRRNR